MIGERENSFCPTCGGRMHSGLATIPFILNHDRVVVIKNVPAEICDNCHEPFMNGRVTDEIMALLKQLQTLGSEVSVLLFPQYAMA
jgi:YgiT-type zinc finger domain-containing protein